MTNARMRVLLSLLCVATAVLLIAGNPLAAGTEGDKSKPAKATAQDTSKYVGSDACMACHEDVFKNWETTPHYKTTLYTRGGPAKQGCESCHGPGADHIEGGGDKTKITIFKELKTRQVSETCLSCHQYGQEHSNFARAAHNINDVSCISCHSVHKPRESQFLLAKKQPDLCYTCHTDIKPQFSRPFHHRVNEGLVKCSECHNQHGGFLTAQLRATNAQDTTCFKCHVEKAGPFVFEHAPVKTEGCVACHSPHGSTNPRLLKRSQVNLLCLECHTLTSEIAGPGIPTFHNQTQKYQACTMCHTQIHGSNHSAVFFR